MNSFCFRFLNSNHNAQHTNVLKISEPLLSIILQIPVRGHIILKIRKTWAWGTPAGRATVHYKFSNLLQYSSLVRMGPTKSRVDVSLSWCRRQKIICNPITFFALQRRLHGLWGFSGFASLLNDDFFFTFFEIIEVYVKVYSQECDFGIFSLSSQRWSGICNYFMNTPISIWTKSDVSSKYINSKVFLKVYVLFKVIPSLNCVGHLL